MTDMTINDELNLLEIQRRQVVKEIKELRTVLTEIMNRERLLCHKRNQARIR